MSIRRLTNPTEAQLESCARVLMSAYSTDPGTVFLTNLDPVVMRLHYLKGVTTAGLDGELWVAPMKPKAAQGEAEAGGEGDEEQFGAVMCVWPPGLDMSEGPNSNGPHAKAANEAYPPAGRAYGERVIAAGHDLEVNAYGPGRTKPTYYVSQLGTHEDAQGQGLAGALLRSVVARGKEEGERVTLITQNEGNVRYYGKFGFTNRAEVTVEAPGYDSHWWALCMDPKEAK